MNHSNPAFFSPDYPTGKMQQPTSKFASLHFYKNQHICFIMLLLFFFPLFPPPPSSFVLLLGPSLSITGPSVAAALVTDVHRSPDPSLSLGDLGISLGLCLLCLPGGASLGSCGEGSGCGEASRPVDMNRVAGRSSWLPANYIAI